jgi:uncharacterized protein YgfB (UPF0149 family)
MPLNQDFSDLFAELNSAEVRYLLVGGYAVGVHAEPRFTKDLDIWVDSTPDNAARTYAALAQFGAPLHQFTAADLERSEVVIQLGLPPNRIDLLTSIDGVSFADAWDTHIRIQYGSQVVHVISARHLIQNKRASARPQDLADVEALEKYRRG